MAIKEELQVWLKENQSKNPRENPRDIHLASFLAAKKDIEEALGEGFSVMVIWKFLRQKKRIECSYPTFNRYIHKLIDPKLLHKKNSAQTKVSRFTYNPKPNKGDLV